MKLLSIIVALFVFSAAYAEEGIPVHGWTPEQMAEQAAHNEQVAASDFLNHLWPDGFQALSTAQDKVPYSEIDEAGYLIFSDPIRDGSSLGGEPKVAKKAMAENLPAGVTLVVMTRKKDKERHEEIREFFKDVIDSDRLKIMYLPPGGNAFWARDGVPVPVWSLGKSGSQFSVVDAKYYHRFEQDKKISEHFSAKLIKHDYYFEGGNFIVNSIGDCLVVDNVRVKKMPDSIFKDKYGCSKLVRFPHTKGIGHADESLKFLDNDTVMTDDDGYEEILKENGYKVVRLPRPKKSYETYVNSLTINDTIFLPVFEQETDEEVISKYESFGYKVIPLKSISLSNRGLGSIHCITMTYPPVSYRDLLDHMGGEELN